ncbi:hypothetical protein ABZ490_52000 [Streptomyces sp. NPDC005811]|uniref:hypothetical protein n=1 Tax=Streptomyces sp. NPDC005811 TaxID=3154565 RepID=UPI0033FEE9A0
MSSTDVSALLTAEPDALREMDKAIDETLRYAEKTVTSISESRSRPGFWNFRWNRFHRKAAVEQTTPGVCSTCFLRITRAE